MEVTLGVQLHGRSWVGKASQWVADATPVPPMVRLSYLRLAGTLQIYGQASLGNCCEGSERCKDLWPLIGVELYNIMSYTRHREQQTV